MNVFVGDIEANGLLDTITKVHCGVFKNINTGFKAKFRPTQIHEMLRFMDTIDVLIMHNGLGYDWPALKKVYGYEFKGKKVDTLIMSRLLNPKRMVPYNCPNKKAGPNSVEAWGYRVGRGKPEHNDWENFSEDMLHRCDEDVEIQHLIYEALLKEAAGATWRPAFLLSFKLFEFLQQQEAYGWLVDKPHMVRCVERLTKRITLIDAAITPKLPQVLEIEETKKNGEYNFVRKPFKKNGDYSESVLGWCNANNYNPHDKPVLGCFSRISFRPTDLESNLETKDFLLKLGWEPLEWNTDDEGNRTSPKLSKDDPFDGIEGKLGKRVARRVQCKQRRGIIEGLLSIVRPDGRIASSVNTLAVTGRATHRGIVNIPRAGSFYGSQMRKIFVCKPGYVIVGTDSDSCQLRMLAGRMGSAAYIDAIVNGDKKKGTDNHSLTMKVAELDSRDTAKTTMYCLLFGGGDAKLGKSAKKPGQGKEVRAKLYRGLDGLEELVARLKKEWRATAKKRPGKYGMEYYDGFITGLDGRPIKVPSEHALLVYLLQSDEAVMMSCAYVLANKRLASKYRYGIDYGFLCYYHDETQIECREEIAEDVGKIMAQAIVDAGKFYNIKCPHVGEYHIGRNWYETH